MDQRVCRRALCHARGDVYKRQLEAAANYMLTLEQMTGQLDAMGVARKAAEE